MTRSLEPISPQKARDMYYEERKEDAAYDTMGTVEKGIDLFVSWCEETGVENMNEMTGRKLNDYKAWCKVNTENSKISLNGLFSTLRRFLVYCVTIEAVSEDLPNRTPIPNVKKEDEISEEKPSTEEVEQTAQYLEEHEPASRRHLEHALMRKTGSRVGAIRSIDLEDVDLEEKVIKYKHRPADDPDKKGTPLKNGTDGERHVNIPKGVANLIERYLNSPDRHDVTDEFGREPLLTTKNGRPNVGTIRRDLYKLTRPCEYAGECPHDRQIEDCKAAENNHASKCPSSHSPHPLRRWSIEEQIERGVPKDELSNRVDVSIPVLNKHYDRRGKERRRKNRLRIFEKLYGDYGEEDETLDDIDLDLITDDDGMIDSVALHQLIMAKEHAQETESAHPNERTESKPKEAGNSVVTDFRGDIPFVDAAVEWTSNRLRRELEAMTPASEESPSPSPERAAKASAAYFVFVCMLGMNFALIGLVPG